jgi:hypothetical protein
MSTRHVSPKQKQQKNRKRKREDADDITQPHDEQPQTTEQLQQVMSERLERIRKTYLNKQRVLVLCSRGITFRFRHLMQDILDLLPHTKKDVKLDTKDKLWMINEICEMKNCNNSIFFEVRKKQDLYMWIAKSPNGPSVKFHVLNGSHFNNLNLMFASQMASLPSHFTTVQRSVIRLSYLSHQLNCSSYHDGT